MPLFMWSRRPDAALVSLSATQAAHEIVGDVEIIIGDFSLLAAVRHSTRWLYRQCVQRFGYGPLSAPFCSATK